MKLENNQWYAENSSGRRVFGPGAFANAKRIADYWGTEPHNAADAADEDTPRQMAKNWSSPVDLPIAVRDQRRILFDDDEDVDEDEDTEQDDIEITPICTVESKPETKDQIAARIHRENALLSRVGIVPTQPLFAVGTPINSEGKKNRLAKRAEVEAMPGVEGLLVVADRIDAEKREDKLVRAADLRMTPSGNLTDVAGNWMMPIEEPAFIKLLSKLRYFPRMAEGLAMNGVEERVDYFNSVMDRREEEGFAMANGDDLVLNLGSRLNANRRSLYRVVSPTYQTGLNGAGVLRAQYEAMKHSGANVDVSYDPASTIVTSDLVWNENHGGDLGAGSVFRVGLRAKTGDMGNHGFFVEAFALRNLCLNLIIIATETAGMFYARHVGEAIRIVQGMQGALKEGYEAFGPFLREWGIVSRASINDVEIWNQRFENVEAAIEWGVKKGKLMPGVAKKVAFDAMMTSFGKEPGQDLAALINAQTRAAHESFLDSIQRDRIERESGNLMKVLVRAAS